MQKLSRDAKKIRIGWHAQEKKYHFVSLLLKYMK